jgi:hypothetical protein
LPQATLMAQKQPDKESEGKKNNTEGNNPVKWMVHSLGP